MAALTREQILGAHDLGVEEYAVEEWAGSVFLRKMSGRDRMELKAYSDRIEASGEQLSPGFYATRFVMDAQGEPLFTEEDAAALEDKNAEVLDRIILAALALNGLGVDAGDAEKN